MASLQISHLLVILVLPLLSNGDLQRQTCSRGSMATIQPSANAWLGGIITFNNPGNGGYGCGLPGGSMQAYEAIRWVLDLLNKKGEFLQTQFLTDHYVPGIKLGMMVRNDCGNELTAAASVLDIFPELKGDAEACTEQTNNLTLGIIGGSSSDSAMSLSDATMTYNIPIISYEATAPSLTTSGLYKNFMRTISPDGPLMEVINKVLKELQWKFVVIVYNSDSYGQAAYSELHRRLVSSDICLTQGIMVDADDVSSASSTLRKVLATRAVGVIYFGPDTYADALIAAGNTMLTEADRLQWIFVDFPLDTTFISTSVYQRGIISISAASRFMVEFEDHWIRINESDPSLENPWFKEWYGNQFNCKFTPTAGQRDCASIYQGTPTEKELQKREEFQQDQYVEAAVLAVYTYARALRMAQMALCPGVSGVCSALQNMTREIFYNDYLKKVNFTFTADERVPSLASKNIAPYNAAKHLSFTPEGDIQDPSYYIWNYNDIETGFGAKTFRFRRVGSYINGYLDLNLNNIGMYNASRQVLFRPLPSSPCPSTGCMPCLGVPADVKYYFEQGDVIVHGIFSLHNMGITPLTCGTRMSDNQFIFLEAMIYGVRKVNQNINILRNVVLGGLGMDDCSDAALGQAFIAQVVRGSLNIVDQAGKKLDPHKIEAYSAAHTTTLTLPLAEAMNILMKPMVGYRAVGSKLQDKTLYPYYIHSLPGIYQEIQALIFLLKRLNWMFVQVVTSDMYYSQDAEEVFRDLGSKAGICIVATHNIGTTSQDADRVVEGLAINRATPPTVVLLEPNNIHRLLMAFVNRTAERSSVVLIGLTRWGTDEMAVKELKSVAQGVITLEVMHSTLQNFTNYLKTLNVETYTLNPWFKEWYGAAHNCSIAGQGSGAPCNISSPVTSGVNYRLLYQVEHVINAIRAIGHGLDKVLRLYCGDSYTSICVAFLSAPDKGKMFLEEIKKVSFDIEDMNPASTFRFDGSSALLPFAVNGYDNGAYYKIGEINTGTNELSLQESSIAMYPGQTLNAIMPTCRSPCLECLYMFNYINYWYIPGDVVIAAIFDIHYSGTNGPFSCGTVRAKNGGLYTEVFNFALQKINSGTALVRLNNVTLGGLAFDGCTNPPRATAIVNRVHTGMEIMDSTGQKLKTSQLASWLTYDSQTTIDAANLLQKFGMPIVSPGATAKTLDNKSQFYTFFRTVPSDSTVVRGMADFIKEMNWPYVIVLNAPDTANREARDLFRKYLADYGICIVANFEFVTDGNMNVIIGNILILQTQVVAVFSEPDLYIKDLLETHKSVSTTLRYIANRPWGLQTQGYSTQLQHSVFFDLSSPTIPEFTNYLNGRQVLSSNNPWFQEIYQELFQCNLVGTYRFPRSCTTTSTIPNSGNWEQDIWTLSTLNAVYALAQGVHMSLQMKCGMNYMGICADFMFDENIRNLIMANMDAENFTDIANLYFQFIAREANGNLILRRYTDAPSAVQEGSLLVTNTSQLTLNNKNTLQGYYTGIRSECTGDCLVCSSTNADLQDFTLIPGDTYIVGLFDVHKQGVNPFSCGEINPKHGLPLLEAFSYALEYINNKTGMFRDILPGVQIGGIGLDMCMSPTRAANLVANIHSGNINLAKNGISVNPRKIDAYIATMDTESTIRVADILTQLAIPQISYGATGIDLLNMEKYSYFLRSVPADDKQARAIVSYLKKFNFNNIQVIGSFDEIGEPGMKEFKRLAFVNRICITKEYTIGERGNVTADASRIVSLVGQRGDAQVVVLWMKDPLPLLLTASSNTIVGQHVLFIATDKWGADPDYLTISGIANLLKNKHLVILDVETADIPGFDRYLEFKTPDNYVSNPWFKEYFEDFQNCYWSTPSATHSKACDKSSTIPRADNYLQDPYTLYVINAVFSAALGIHKALEKLCLVNGLTQYYGVCNLYATSGERRQKVMEGLWKVNYTDDTHQPFFYTADGQSDRGFHIYNITSVNNVDFEYENVGSYNDTHFLKLDITYDSVYSAICDADGSNFNLVDCICKFPPDMPSRYMKRVDGNRGLTLVYIGDIHQAHPTDPLACGPINTGVDLQRLFAFFYAIELVNSNPLFPNSLKLDGLALDSCTHSLRLGQDVYNVLSGNSLCDSDAAGYLVSPSSIAAFVIDQDRNAIPVASMLSKEKIISISPTAGNAILNDPFIYPYFLRTRGDNVMTAQALLGVARQAGWDYLSVVYTDSISYQGTKDSLLDKSASEGACVGASVALPVNATLSDAENVLSRLSQQVGARGVVLFVTPEHYKLLLQASQSTGLTGRFVWLVASDWTKDSGLIENYEQEAAGAIMVEVRSAILQSFTDYVKSLSLSNKRGIPNDWFQEIYETLHQCNVLDLEHLSNRRYSSICNGDEVITDNMVSQDPSVLHVIISVFSVAYGLQNIKQCEGNTLDISACLQLLANRNDEIYQGILGTNFRVLPTMINNTFTFSFDNDGNGNGGYIINNYRASSDVLSPYKVYQLGEYTSLGLTIDLSNYAGGNLYNQGVVPSSNCAPGTTCTCQLSSSRTWMYSPSQVLASTDIRVGGLYKDPVSGESVRVDSIPGPGDRFHDAWAIILAILACLGTVVSLAIFVYLLIMYPVRGGTSILGFILSFGIILLYLMVFPFIAHADERICGLRRFALGFVYAIVYSALMVKLVDCVRVKTRRDVDGVKYNKLGRPFGLFMVTVFLILVQVMINAEWLILRESTYVRIFYKDAYWPRCSPDDFYDESLVLSLVYIMAIIFVSLILALFTFSSRKNHRESRWILGILILTIPCWVIWCCVSILAAKKVRDAAVAVGLLVNATIILLLIPVRKLYLLHKYNTLIEEEEEKQSVLAPSQRGNDYSSVVYGRQYDNKPRLHEGSVIGSANGYHPTSHDSAVNY